MINVMYIFIFQAFKNKVISTTKRFIPTCVIRSCSHKFCWWKRVSHLELLHLDNGNVAVSDQDTLNIYFSGVFTKENLTSIPVMNNIYSTSPSYCRYSNT